jgi:N-acyl-D-amino-acid deacylase
MNYLIPPRRLMLCAFAISAITLWSCATPRLELDTLIHGGTVIDGTGAARARMDIGIKGERIVFVGNSAKTSVNAVRTLDAQGLIVAPGFIDPHTHADAQLATPKSASNQAYLFQGVTTVLTGNDGEGPWPIGATLTKWQDQGLATNVGLFVGHGTLRLNVVGKSDVAPSAEQMQSMGSMVREAMTEGAFGLSTGLFYAPAIYAKPEEIIELAKVSASMGGIYDTHMRSESSGGVGLLAAIEETLRVGREANSAVHISHIKALGADMWGKSEDAIKLVMAAQAQGVKVTANQYPYSASALSLVSALIPAWAQSGGTDELIKRINDPQQRERLNADVEKNLKIRGGPDAIQFRTGAPEAIVKQRLSDVMKTSQQSAIDAAYDLIKRNVPLPIVSFNMSEADIENLMRQKWVMTGSDGTLGHPRMYGTFARKLSEYVRNKKVLSLEQAVHSSTGLTAATFGIKDRGVLREGAFADVVVFNANTIVDNATYLEPTLIPSGIPYILVNGKVVIDNGNFSGTLAGKALRK